MGRNEIRLRRQRRTASGPDRFRNYGFVLERHKKEQRLKKIMRVFGFFAVILILIMVIIMLSQWGNDPESPHDPTAIYINSKLGIENISQHISQEHPSHYCG